MHILIIFLQLVTVDLSFSFKQLMVGIVDGPLGPSVAIIVVEECALDSDPALTHHRSEKAKNVIISANHKRQLHVT